MEYIIYLLMVCNAYVFSFEYKIGWCYVSCMHIPTYIYVVENITYTTLKYQKFGLPKTYSICTEIIIYAWNNFIYFSLKKFPFMH